LLSDVDHRLGYRDGQWGGEGQARRRYPGNRVEVLRPDLFDEESVGRHDLLVCLGKARYAPQVDVVGTRLSARECEPSELKCARLNQRDCDRGESFTPRHRARSTDSALKDGSHDCAKNSHASLKAQIENPINESPGPHSASA